MASAPPPSGNSGKALDVGESLAFFFRDANWPMKMLIGSLFVLLGIFIIGSIFVIGYSLRLARAAMKEASPALPDWDDLGGMLLDGLRALVVYLGHTLPLVLLIVVLALAVGGGASLIDMDETSEGFGAFIALALVGGYILFFLIMMAVLVYLPAAMARFVLTDDVTAAFQFQENLQFIRGHASDYFLALLVIILSSFIAQFGVFAFCVGIFPASFWQAAVTGYVAGRLAALAGRDGTEAPLAELVD